MNTSSSVIRFSAGNIHIVYQQQEPALRYKIQVVIHYLTSVGHDYVLDLTLFVLFS